MFYVHLHVQAYITVYGVTRWVLDGTCNRFISIFAYTILLIWHNRMTKPILDDSYFVWALNKTSNDIRVVENMLPCLNDHIYIRF